jgi:hypothetical protein
MELLVCLHTSVVSLSSNGQVGIEESELTMSKRKKQICPVCNQEADFLLSYDFYDDGRWTCEWNGDVEADIDYMREDKSHVEYLVCGECGVAFS